LELIPMPLVLKFFEVRASIDALTLLVPMTAAVGYAKSPVFLGRWVDAIGGCGIPPSSKQRQ
jgi:hypothetical protein